MTVTELERYGLESMDDAATTEFLADHDTGILGLPTGDVPYLLPLSYGFDGADTLYFTYLLGETSEKASLTDETDRARFLVYDVESTFRWESVLLTGAISRVPEDEWDDVAALARNAWRPNTLQSAVTAGGVAVYRFDIEERAGIRQRGLAPDFRENIEP